ncbi:leucine-rich repeat protein [Skeletonema marinoi]|uniref:Leucine-rich repeat protein n=1 Tax=Skeletonema marinoi TaxID=267567 RepID=A0AAD9DHM2_9STRA|nr:leucine-rich repeat protein [Skeletonema marinoi]
MSSSSDNESVDSDEGSLIQSLDGSFIEYTGYEPVDNDIRLEELHLLRVNRPNKTSLLLLTSALAVDVVSEWTEEAWELLGRDVAGNEYLREMKLVPTADFNERDDTGVLNDQNMTSLFRGLTRSDSLREINLRQNGFGLGGIQAMVPFLQASNNLRYLNINRNNNVKSEGFRLLWRALRDSPIETLWCGWCGVENIEIDDEHIPKRLEKLNLGGNNINSDGCRELTKLLLKEDTTLQGLHLRENNIDDEGVEILVNALRNNTSLIRLSLDANEKISKKGTGLMLRLVNDISSIKATLQSNHTLIMFGQGFGDMHDYDAPKNSIRHKLRTALDINRNWMGKQDLAALAAEAGQKKVISTQLNSKERTSLCYLQEVDICNEALYSEINPLHLPEVLAMVGRHHGQSELYVALVSSIAGLFSTVNRKKFLQDRVEHHLSIIQEHTATVETLRTEIAAIEEAEVNREELQNEFESLGFKRRRT